MSNHDRPPPSNRLGCFQHQPGSTLEQCPPNPICERNYPLNFMSLISNPFTHKGFSRDQEKEMIDGSMDRWMHGKGENGHHGKEDVMLYTLLVSICFSVLYIMLELAGAFAGVAWLLAWRSSFGLMFDTSFLLSYAR